MSMAPPAPAASAPMAPPPPPAVSLPRLERERATEVSDKPAAPDAYLTKLGVLARELEQAKAKTQLRLLRQRLTEWVEDARSVGHDELAAQVDALVRRLAGDPAESEVRAVVAELIRLSTTAAVAKPGRGAFWK